MTSLLSNIKSKWPIRRVIGTGFGFALLILVAGSLISYRSTNKMLSAANALSHSHKINGLLKDMVSGLAFAESNERNYVFTGRDEYLSNSRSSIVIVQNKIEELNAILKEGSLQNKRLGLLMPLVEKRIMLMEETLSARQIKGFDNALGLLLSHKSKFMMRSILNVIGYMEREENSLLSAGTIEAGIFSERIKTIIILGNIITIVVMASSLIVIFIDFSNRNFFEQELIKAKEIAEDSVKVKEQFLANISHEIRTPMNAISGLSKILLRSETSESQKKYLNSIKTSSDILLVIINDILDLSKAKSGKMVFERVEFSLSQLISYITDLLNPRVEDKNISLSTNIDKNIPDLLVGDAVRLNQIILNLVSNSIKFTEKGGISINIEILEQDGATIRLKFTVLDTGIGIPEEMMPVIFESFTQASTETTRKYGGTGLGLNIVKELVELQGGSIKVNSKVNYGTEFSFSMLFPVAEPKQNEFSENISLVSTSQNYLKGLNVLLVEDNLINQMVALAVLNEFGCTTCAVDNGKDALHKIQQNQFDLILMDVQMPEMSGYDLTRIIRNSFPEPMCLIPIIAMTANAGKADEKKCLNAGMDDFISKPFEESLLFNKMNYWSKRKNIWNLPDSPAEKVTGNEIYLE
jgi:signal transduction histidine kinase/ActR/RegA family two-component response regulator